MQRMFSRYSKWFSRDIDPHYADPLYAGRHPFQTYLLALCVISVIPQMFGRHTATSIEALLPHWIALAWIYSLGAGAMVALVGSRMPRRQYATGLVLEQLGLYLVATPATVYSLAIILYAGWGGLPAASIVLAFAIASAIRARDIGRVLHRARMLKEGTPLTVPATEAEQLAAETSLSDSTHRS